MESGTERGGEAARRPEGPEPPEAPEPIDHFDHLDHPELALGVRELRPEDEPALLDLFERCADWFERALGLPPAPGDVQGLYYALPEGAHFAQKRLLVVVVAGEVAGLVDLVADHPGPGECAVGMFLVAPAYRRWGVGRAVAERLLDRARAARMRRVTATVGEGDVAARRLVESLGFAVSAEAAPPNRGTGRPGPFERPVRRAVLEL